MDEASYLMVNDVFREWHFTGDGLFFLVEVLPSTQGRHEAAPSWQCQIDCHLEEMRLAAMKNEKCVYCGLLSLEEDQMMAQQVDDKLSFGMKVDSRKLQLIWINLSTLKKKQFCAKVTMEFRSIRNNWHPLFLKIHPQKCIPPPTSFCAMGTCRRILGRESVS